MPDFRSLISRMADELDYYRQLLMDDRREVHALATEARAALAQPEPEGPTDEELLSLDQLRDTWNAQADAANSWDELGVDEIIWWAQRQALARWGRPAPEPVPVAWCRTDEFSNAIKRGGSFNGWKDPGAGANKCDMRLYALLPQPH